jgi:hypothetical protein
MQHKNAYSDTRAATQTYLFLVRFYDGPRSVKRADARIAATIVKTIWCVNQVGLFQLKQKHVREYWYHHTNHLDPVQRARYRAALERMLHALGKDHWRF